MLGIANNWLHSFLGGSKNKAAGRPIKVIMTGLHSVGKTTILSKYDLMVKLHLPIMNEMPVITFSLAIYKSPRTRLEVKNWDTPGRCPRGGTGNRDVFRHLLTRRLRYLLNGSEALVFVVDSDSSRKWIEEEELHWYLNLEELRGVPLLVLANMKDGFNAMPLSEIRDSLGLTSLKGRWRLHGVCALPGTGLSEAFEWISAGCPDLRLATPWHDLMLLRSLYVRGRASIKEGVSLEDVMRFLCENNPEICAMVCSFLWYKDGRLTGVDQLSEQ
jgi:hypothetical protein